MPPGRLSDKVSGAPGFAFKQRPGVSKGVVSTFFVRDINRLEQSWYHLNWRDLSAAGG